MTALSIDTIEQASRSIRVRRPPRLLRILSVLLRRQRRTARTYLELSRLDERLLYDIGIDPLDVREALQNQRTPSILMEPMRRQYNFGDDIRRWRS